MRKYVKDKLLDLIKTLEEMNQFLERIIVKNDMQQLIEFLGDEQQAAVAIGEKIEEAMGTQSATITMLEAYCEQLWNMSQKTERKELKYCCKQLKKQIREIKVSVQEFPEQYQVVFLPYKASMWDCMESVWKAAEKDPDCICYVLPIPYYDLLPDGSLGACHYEAELMPKYVPIVPFNEFQMMEEHPDIIYIHNPYDNMNRVTSVDPAYYSHILKQYTDKLVYIPYYSLRGNMPLSHRFLPAYYYSDIIILQNKCMLEDIDSSIPREKLLVLGSPKEECMIHAELHKEEIYVPDGWKEQLKDKTVFFLNTSITSILNDGTERINKIEEVFDVIAGREDAVLFWRPHPLIEATLQAMRPELEQKYSGLIKRFQREKLGILDMTADVERAVALSDAYIGESSSSVIELFHVACKPRIFLGTKIFYQPTMDELHSEGVWDICEGDGDWWFISEKLQLLCKFSTKEEKIDVIAAVPEIPGGMGIHYAGIVYFEKQLMLIPWRADAVCIYDIESGSFTKYYFQDEYVNYCFEAILFGQDLFLVPGDYPAIVRFNIKTKQFFYYKQCIEDICRAADKKMQGMPFTRWNIGWYGEKIYLSSRWSNNILTFNMKTLEYDIDKVGDAVNYVAIISDEYYNWLLTDGAEIIKWDKGTGSITKYKLCIKDMEQGQIPFLDILDFGDRLYLFPYQERHICVFYKETGESEYIDFGLPYQEDEYESRYYESIGRRYTFVKKVSDHEIIAFSNYNRSFILIDLECQQCKIFPLRVENHAYWELRRRSDYPMEIWENENNLLATFVDHVVSKYPVQYYRRGAWRPEIVSDCNIGEQIHTEVKKFESAHS